MTTIIDVANDCGVSISTVSNVLRNNSKKFVSPEIRSLVLKSCKKLDYKVNVMASSLVTKRTNLIGLFLTSEKDKFDPFYAKLIAGVGVTSSLKGYSPVLFLNVLGESDISNIFLSGRGMIDGAIILTPMEDDFRIKELKRDNIKYTVIGKPLKDDDALFVDVDNENNTYLVTKHILSNGHKKILFLNGHKSYTISADRLRGFNRALAEMSNENLNCCAFSLDEIKVPLNEFISSQYRKQGYTAVIIESDNLASEVYHFAKEKNLEVGKNFAVASLGGDREDLRFPGLSTIYIDHYKIGAKATELIIKQINGESTNEEISGILDVSEIKYKKSSHFIL